MKNPLQLLFSVALALLLLVACGTAEEPTNEPAPDNMTANTENEEDDQGEDKDKVTAVNNETPTEEKKEDNITAENTIKYSQNGKEYSAETNLLDEANYSIRVLEGYELVNEEPGKDVLSFKENPELFMRIEVFSKDSSTYEDVVKNTEDFMNVYGQYESYDISEAVNDKSAIGKSTGYIATFDQDKIIGVVFEKKNILVRLTIFDHQEYDLKDAFIKMGLTIEEK